MKKLFLISIALGLLFSCKQEAEDINLSSLDWRVKKRGVDTTYAATVPGTIHTDLMAAGVIPNVFYGTNEQEVQWVGETTWEYSSTFSLTRSQLKRERIILEFEGLDTYASVFLNDSLVLQANNMFRAWEVDIKPYVRQGENSLMVVFEPAAERGRQEADGLAKPLPEGDRAFVRKAAYHFGWDWGPRFVTAGIWKEGRIRMADGLSIKDVRLELLQLDSAQAVYELGVNLENPGASGIFLEVEMRLDTFFPAYQMHAPLSSFKQELTRIPGPDHIQTKISIPNPKLWWVHTMGNQPLYDLELRLRSKKDGVLLDQKHLRVGIREIELVQEPDSLGQSFYFKLNGVPLFAKGANYIPADYFPHRSPEKMETLLLEAREAHMNMLRVWGGGIYEDDRFYELCDELGILVWQDFMFANTMYPGDSAFLENVREEISYQVKRLRHHPSIALWCGNNEISEGWFNWGWQKQFAYTAEDSLRIYADYLHLFEELIPDVLAEEDPTRPYHPSSPMTGWGRKESLLQGDVHYWGVWWGMEPFEVYEKKIGRFHSEHGFQGIPAMASLRQFIPQEDLKQGSSSMKTHQKHPTGYETIREYMERDYPVPENFEDYVYVSQLLQARGISLATRAHRMNKPYTMGSLYWQLNDVWPVTSWSSIDYYGRPKALQYALKRDFAPYMLGVKELGGPNLEVWAVSDIQQDKDLTLKIEEFDFSGLLLYAKQEPVRVEAMQSGAILSLPPSQSFRQGGSFYHFALMNDQEMLAEYFHFGGRPKDLPLMEGSLSVKWISDEELELELQNAFFKNVYVEAGGMIFDRNYFDALPGTYRLKVKANPLYERRPEIKIKTLNMISRQD